MQIVIELTESQYKYYAKMICSVDTVSYILVNALKNGTPLPKHGRLIDADRINLHNISPCDDEMLAVYGATVEDIEEAPTILEADGGTSE